MTRVVVPTLLLVVWWVTVGPVILGGPATFVIVDGASMEPTYRSGDLVIARRAGDYRVDDVVVFHTPDRRRAVIHRIAEGDEQRGWITRGDNNRRNDSWLLPDAAILGREWVVVPRVGASLWWTQQHPLRFAAAVGAFVLVSALADRRGARAIGWRGAGRGVHRMHPTLRDALARAQRAPRRAGRPLPEIGLLVAAAGSGVVSVVLLVHLITVGLVRSLAGAVLGGVAVVAGSVAWSMLRRLADGHGVPEPHASRYVLAGLVWRCDGLPTLERCVDVRSAIELRELAARTTGRVLWEQAHDADGTVRDVYLTIDAEGVAHRWVTTTWAPERVAERGTHRPDAAGAHHDPVASAAAGAGPLGDVTGASPEFGPIGPAMSVFDELQARLDALRDELRQGAQVGEVSEIPGLEPARVGPAAGRR